MTRCTACGAELDPEHPATWDPEIGLLTANGKQLRLCGMLAQVFDMLWHRRNGITKEQIFDVLYSLDPQGGPLTGINILSVRLTHLRRRLAPLGLGISYGGWKGAFRLIDRVQLRTCRRWTTPEIEQLETLYAAGHSQKAIGDILGRSHTSIQAAIVRFGLSPAARRRDAA